MTISSIGIMGCPGNCEEAEKILLQVKNEEMLEELLYKSGFLDVSFITVPHHGLWIFILLVETSKSSFSPMQQMHIFFQKISKFQAKLF